MTLFEAVYFHSLAKFMSVRYFWSILFFQTFHYLELAVPAISLNSYGNLSLKWRHASENKAAFLQSVLWTQNKSLVLKWQGGFCKKEILKNQSNEKALNKQWETPNPIKVNRVPKAPQVQMI